CRPCPPRIWRSCAPGRTPSSTATAGRTAPPAWSISRSRGRWSWSPGRRRNEGRRARPPRARACPTARGRRGTAARPARRGPRSAPRRRAPPRPRLPRRERADGRAARLLRGAARAALARLLRVPDAVRAEPERARREPESGLLRAREGVHRAGGELRSPGHARGRERQEGRRLGALRTARYRGGLALPRGRAGG